jgi:hypothetical protein
VRQENRPAEVRAKLVAVESRRFGARDARLEAVHRRESVIAVGLPSGSVKDAFANVDDHALAVDVLHAKPDQFAAPDASRVERHEDGARLEIAGGVDQLGHFLWAQHARHAMTGVLRDTGWSRVESGASASARRRTAGRPSAPGSRSQLPFVQQMRLPLPDMVRAELIWRLAEIAREPRPAVCNRSERESSELRRYPE